MKVLRLLSAVIVLQIASVVVQSSASHGRGEFSRSKRLATANNNTCSIQQLKSIHGAILKRPKEGNNSSVARGEKVEFVCKDGYRLVGKLNSFVCQGDGNWTEFSPKQNGFCESLKSDQGPCGPTLIDVTGRATGILTSSAIQTPPNVKVDCTWKLVTKDPGFYIKLLFVDFSLSPDCANNYISLENVNFIHQEPDRLKAILEDFNTIFDDPPDKKLDCCSGFNDSVCRFGEQKSPPLSRSVSQSMTIKFHSKTPSKSRFKAIWYNVNGLFPNGLIPKQDATYAPKIVFNSAQKTTEAPTDTPSVLALTIFGLIVFAIGAFIACKLGKHYLGPSFSFGHFRAWVSSRCTSRAPSTPRRHQEGPQEARGLMMDTDSPFTGARIHIRPADRLRHEDESDGSSLDSSSLMMA
ncbi:hypothetical protein ACROYT_G004465 [Oculina patagonica]